ncbi:hypothetical protein HPB50_000429 [Hyalomma asiaticum]|uniref:Uncharacterized protein n=1 Tax=Hyalomma asiaticum TaxID=266040 RepID=A0ACB7RPH6_HYAAI|nr:hypothetical protein HPB50_000429 [Hyalomma asiaticum]
MESSGVPSKHASSTTPTTPRLLAVAAPGREDLVVLVNTSAIRMPIISRPASGLDMDMSPAGRFLDRDEGTPPDERRCTQLWVLWAALTFPLLLSCWLLLVPFLIGSKEPVVPEVPVYPLPKTPGAPINQLNLTSTTHSTPAISPIAMPTASTTPATARFAWLGIPPRCLLRVGRPSEPSSYTIGPYPTRVAAANRKQRPIFCLFDNDKVTSSRVPQQMSDYMFETLPFALCPNVVYASVGIVNGYLTSRLPHFEQSHGIPRLKQIVQTRGYQDTRILLVLGGYKEDAPHFWRLGRDATTLDLLMKNVADGMRNNKLDGVTVHWVAPTSVCSGSDYAMVLSILLRRLNQTFNNYGLTQHIVSVVLDIGIGNEYMVDTVADVVHYFFLGTNALRYQGQGPYQDMCTDISRDTHQVIANYTRLSRSVRIDQLCIMEELAPWADARF